MITYTTAIDALWGLLGNWTGFYLLLTLAMVFAALMIEPKEGE